MAEIIFSDMIKNIGREKDFLVLSRATSTEELGNPIYPPARAELSKHGFSSDGKYAVQLEASDYDKYDVFIGMDSANVRNMNRIFGGDPQNKIKKLMEFTARGGDVADPWYTGRFDITYRDICEGCAALLKTVDNI